MVILLFLTCLTTFVTTFCQTHTFIFLSASNLITHHLDCHENSITENPFLFQCWNDELTPPGLLLTNLPPIDKKTDKMSRQNADLYYIDLKLLKGSNFEAMEKAGNFPCQGKIQANYFGGKTEGFSDPLL